MSDYDMNIHSSRRAEDWNNFFWKTWGANLNSIDYETMFGWFANAMMAMHDSIHNNEIKKLEKALDEARNLIDDLWEKEPEKIEMLDLIQEYLKQNPMEGE